jgi:adenosine deaminase
VNASLPKAELHCHIEGAMSPALARRIAQRNGVDLPAGLFASDGSYAWHDFISFLAAYDASAAALRRAEDYAELIDVYLRTCAAEGAIYVEVFDSPDHAATVGLSYAEQIAGLAAGIDRARAACGIEARIVVLCLRHLGSDRALAVARTMRAEPHPYVVGFGMAGNERQFAAADFAPAFRLADDAGYGCTVHAGEVAGPESVHAVLAALPVSRIGHGVRAAEDPALLDELARRGTVLEVCPGSNVALGLYPDRASHPLQRLIAAGCRVTLNSDDPAFFGTSIGREYADAALPDRTLLEITRTALDAAFVDNTVKSTLRQRLAAGAAG